MLEYLMDGASMAGLAGCIYIAYLVVVQAGSCCCGIVKLGRARMRKFQETEARQFRDPALGYYI